MTLRNALLAATIIALPVAASAQPIDGLYISGGVGTSFESNIKLNSHTKGAASGKLADPKAGFSGFGSVGYGYGNGLRAELEVLGLDNQMKARNFGTGTSGGGELVQYGAMANGLYDIDLGLPVTPYVGVGVGYVFQQLNSGYLAIPGAGTANFKNGGLGSFAVQGIVGAAYNFTPALAATVDVRGLDTIGGHYIGARLGSSAASYKIGNGINTSLNVGLRYAFGAAPAPAPMAPAPVVAPAPAPARSYLVFFDWDKADLTARAQQIIAEAAKNANAVKATKIDVAGHADKSGTPAYNQTLSLKRANNVAAELVRLGVPKAEIAITAYGDTRPLVPTAPGVREPQNRRVEIVLH